MPASAPLLIVCATDAECPGLPGTEELVCGVGKTGAAAAVAVRLGQAGVRAVVSFGVAGAYPGGGLAVGDVVVADRCRVIDEGLEQGASFTPFERPGMDVPGAAWIETDAALRSALLTGGHLPFSVRAGPVATVSVCAGTARLAQERARDGAVAESMEGAAVAHVAARFGVPFVEVRGISNPCGPRAGAPFDLRAAVTNARRVLARLVETR
jgi:futalosine hydrolase